MTRTSTRRSALAAVVCSLAAASAAHAAEARIDFGLFGTNYQTASTTGRNWNNVVNPLFGQTKLVDYSSGSATAWSADVTKLFNGLYDLSGPTALGGSAALALNATSAKDSFTAYTQYGSPQITFRNLAPAETYNFGIFASTIGTKSNTAATYTARGATTAIGSINATNNKTDVLNLGGVRPTAAGTITLDIGAAATNNSSWKQVFLNALTLTSVKPAPAPAPTPVAAKNILFFGNSFTAMYDVPSFVATIAAADGKLKPYVVGETSDSRDLTDQIAVAQSSPQNNVNNIAVGQKWDHVVMQDYSSRPTHNGTNVDGGIAGFRADAKTLYNLVKANSPNVKPVLYETWAYRTDSPSTYYAAAPGDGQWTNADQMQAELKSSYALAKADLDALDGGTTILAGVGDKWQQAGFAADLYGDFDAKHPSVRGAALSSLVLYASIYKENVSDIAFAKVADWANTYGLTLADWTRLTALVDANPVTLQGASIAQLNAIAYMTLVPEPASLAALLGLSATLLRRRR